MKRTGYLAKALASILTAVSLAAVPFPSVSGHAAAHDVYAAPQEAQTVVEAEQRKYTLTVATGEFISGAEVTLTVTPDEGYQVKSVSLNGSAVELTNGKYIFTITENSTFAAEFGKISPENVTLTVQQY